MKLKMKKQSIERLRYICLQQMGKDPFADPSRLPPSERTRLLQAIQGKLDSMPAEKIEEEFNELVCEKIFHNGANLERIPVLY